MYLRIMQHLYAVHALSSRITKYIICMQEVPTYSDSLEVHSMLSQVDRRKGPQLIHIHWGLYTGQHLHYQQLMLI